MKNDSGFSLIEVMIALTIFSIFMAVYVTSQGYNLVDSSQMRDEIVIKQYAENIINEIIINPPELKDSLTLAPEEKTMEEDEHYQYTITWKKIFIPDFEKIKGQSEDGEETAQNGAEKMIFEKIKENLEKIVWQLEVKVTKKESGESFSLATWINNDEAKISLGF